mgnify:CR=1 FL=1
MTRPNHGPSRFGSGRHWTFRRESSACLNILKSLFYYLSNGTHIDILGAKDIITSMRPRTVLKKLAPLLEAPSFTAKEAARVGIGAAALARYAKSGDLERLSRGVYRSPTARTIDNFRWEDLFAATRSVKGGVVCLISALAIYNLTEAIPRQHWIAVDHSTRHRANNSVRVVRMRNIKLGRTEIDLGGFKLPIFDRERTIVDAFRTLDRETAIKALKFALAAKKREKRIDMEKLWRYAKKLRVQIEPYVLAVTI